MAGAFENKAQPEVEKVWQPGNLVARKFFKNQALAESFLNPSPALSHKQTILWKHKINIT